MLTMVLLSSLKPKLQDAETFFTDSG